MTLTLDLGEFTMDGDLMLIADQVVNNDPDRQLALQQFVAKVYDDRLATCTPNVVARELVNVPSRLIVTFNYDGLLENAAREQDMEPVTLFGALRRQIAHQTRAVR